MRLYEEEDALMRKFFSENPQTTYACCLDLWKSRAGHHYLGIVLNFITYDWRLHHATLAVKHIAESHTSANIYDSTTAVLKSYGVTPKCYVADNASNQVLCNELLADWSDHGVCHARSSLLILTIAARKPRTDEEELEPNQDVFEKVYNPLAHYEAISLTLSDEGCLPCRA